MAAESTAGVSGRQEADLLHQLIEEGALLLWHVVFRRKRDLHGEKMRGTEAGIDRGKAREAFE